MNENIHEKHMEAIMQLVESLGMDGADDYLCQGLMNTSKKVAVFREKIASLKDSLQQSTNSDEIFHLECDIKSARELLDQLLLELKAMDERYICFRKYLKEKESVNL
ncbi:hypothetical protein [Clostridium formicaceticum]|uniref:Uncharacterized protein n=1 Tax=Clostridium formicaceticum TaxID=1497 RepID=A0AAC9RNJ1_9CLOT|nr:hypothetical protein [Clostridium formicaceticum]AOY77626.1 hypothetical protein BJL90_18240 [Clostridium formicaceticum]ARE88208.1 hypothetical protein CLFO_26090 [Clostridium formicaceticum]